MDGDYFVRSMENPLEYMMILKFRGKMTQHKITKQDGQVAINQKKYGPLMDITSVKPTHLWRTRLAAYTPPAPTHLLALLRLSTHGGVASDLLGCNCPHALNWHVRMCARVVCASHTHALFDCVYERATPSLASRCDLAGVCSAALSVAECMYDSHCACLAGCRSERCGGVA